MNSNSNQNPLNPKLITAYGPKPKQRLTFSKESRAKQEFKDECDINVIMRRYEKTGSLTWLNSRSPMWGEIPELDFRAAMETVVDARARFAALPSAVRERFANDPGKLLAFLSDPKNAEEGIKLGLLEPRGGQGRGALPPTEGGASSPPNQSSGNLQPETPQPASPPARGG